MSLTSSPLRSLAPPMRCSTVTPGKLATFWRKPVRRLKKVDLPQFGGPTMATRLTFPECRECGEMAGAALHPSQPLILDVLRLRYGPELQVPRRFFAERDL